MKRLILLALCCAFLQAKSHYEIAQQLVNDSLKDAKLAVLFSKNQTALPNIKNITQTLKMHGLLAYEYPQSVQQIVTFKAQAHAAIMLKAISSSFEQLGVNYYLPSSYEKNGDWLEIGFMINSKTLVDPGALYLLFEQMGVHIYDVRRDGTNFSYELDFSSAHIDAPYKLALGDVLELKKPLDDYFIELENVRTITIRPSANDIWYPRVLFLDKNLNLINDFSSDVRSKSSVINVPTLSAYLILGDKFSLENIKHGLEITGE